MIKYIELKTGFNDNGPAWIGQVELSKSGKTIYFNGKALKKIHGGGISGNYYDLETEEEYWISGIKKNGRDRHWAGSGKIKIEASIVGEYLKVVGLNELDISKFEIFKYVEDFSKDKSHELENEKL